MHHALNDSSTAFCELRSLCEGFFDELSWIDRCRLVEAADIAPATRSLLVHANHMTATLSQYYNQPVALRVHEHKEDGDIYRRKIVLTIEKGARVVEFGVVRLNLASIDDGVCDAIVRRQVPLGDILNRHNVLTRVEPKWFVRFPKDSPIGCAFHPSPTGDLFGRIGKIYCDRQPVMELLEVVSP